MIRTLPIAGCAAAPLSADAQTGPTVFEFSCLGTGAANTTEVSSVHLQGSSGDSAYGR